MIDLTASEYKIIQDLARKCFSKGTKIWAFGSRIDGTSHDTSDLDLVIHPEKSLSIQDISRELADFKEALQNSSLAILVDSFIWQQLPQDFQRRIQEKYTAFEF